MVTFPISLKILPKRGKKSSMTAPCTEKIALLLTYTEAAKSYCEAVTELHDMIGTIDSPEYHRLHRIAEEARLSVETARVAMELHVVEHGC